MKFLPVHDVELSRTERRRQFVLHDLHTGAVTDNRFSVLDLADAADVETYRSVEFERVTAGGRLGIAEHDADLFAQLVDE